jgi:drug/metabolite transporter (DMT)-like permease
MIKHIQLNDRKKGTLIAIAATILFSNIYIFSKAALNEVSLPKFLFYWFSLAVGINLIIALKTKAFSTFKGLPWKAYRIFFLLGIIEIITTSTFYLAILIIPDPAVTSFMGNMYVVFLVLLGVTLLKEKFTKLETLGVVITIAGAFTVGYQGGHRLQDFFIAGTGIVLINTFSNALSAIVAKKAVEKFSPALINFNRTLFMLMFGFAYFIYSGETLEISPSALRNITIGVIVGPVLAILLIYKSYQYIEASRSSVFQGLKGVFVLIGSYIYFSMLPNTIQLIGGLISITGVLILTLAQARMISLNKIETLK